MNEPQRRLRQAMVGLLTLFLALPALVHLITGPSSAYTHGKRLTEWPVGLAILSPGPEGRDQLADALLERSVLRREAIRWRNRTTLDVFGYIDTDKVVSGAPGWLFYKKSFAAWNCPKHRKLDRGLRRLQLWLDLADANDIPLILAIAPNKASIETEQIAGRAAAYSSCYATYEARMRRALAAHPSPRLVDHANVLRDAPAGDPAYFRTDTHWTRKYGYRAIAQVASKIDGLPEPFEPAEFDRVAKTTDLGNRMLLLPVEESADSVALPIPSTKGSPHTPKVGVMHDSFYNLVSEYVDALIPGVRRRHINSSDFRTRPVDGIDFLVVESVERNLLKRLHGHGAFGWSSSVGMWIQDQTAVAADGCDWSRSRSLRPGLAAQGIEIGSNGLLPGRANATKATVTLPAAPDADRSFCLELEISTEHPVALESYVRVFLGAQDSGIAPEEPDSEHVLGRTIEFYYGQGRPRLAFVLPPSALGRRLRLDFVGLREATHLDSVRIAPSGPLPPRSDTVRVRSGPRIDG